MRVLITSPENDNITRYMRVWAEQLVKKYNNIHHFFHLDKEKANHKRVTGILSKKDMDIACLNGHGDDCRVAGNDNEILIDPDNVSLLAGIKVRALFALEPQPLEVLLANKKAGPVVGPVVKLLSRKVILRSRTDCCPSRWGQCAEQTAWPAPQGCQPGWCAAREAWPAPWRRQPGWCAARDA